MLRYRYELTLDDNGTFLVTFPDIPEAVAVIESPADADIKALNGLLCALDGYFEDSRAIPLPNNQSNLQAVTLPALETAKVLLQSNASNPRYVPVDYHQPA